MLRSSPLPAGRSRRWTLILIAAAIVLAVAWYLGSPLFLNKHVNDAFPMSSQATVPAGMTHQQVENQIAQAAKVNTTMTEAMPSGPASPAILAHGTFTNGDSFHKGEGTAAVYRVNQNLVVRLDPFKVTNGPALHVYLSGHAAPRNSAELHDSGALDLGKLRGNQGAQNYPLPAGVDLAKYHSVVIYCQMFHVVFSTAELGSR
jgi:hypothetical protein